MADGTSASDHVLHLDEHAGILGMDTGGEVDAGPDVILERVRDFSAASRYWQEPKQIAGRRCRAAAQYDKFPQL